MRRIYFAIIVILATGLAMSFSAPADNGKLTIQFNHYVDSHLLELDTVNYTNDVHQAFTVTKFKYYVGNVSLLRKDGTQYQQVSYFLINEEEPLSKQIIWHSIPAGEYTGLSFIIGVDSAHNCTGLQEGALDPINAMFWTWNTGYIFLKLEGKAPASKSPGRIFEYHIGGFREPVNSIRTVRLNFSVPLIITPGADHIIQLKADAAEVLKTPVAIDFSILSSVTDAHNATMIADNYKDMFSIISIN
ncbi:MbnP family protein [Flavipsychrobacter stenotrophus]|nr:MbnP family protein [Flavipsychrobacter stenotrophus]